MKIDSIRIANRDIGEGHPAFIIAEIAQAHDGSLGMAHAYIDAAADAKADAVKFQTHIARAESTRDEPFRINFSYEDNTRYEYWERMEFTKEQWSGLARHAEEKGLIFLSTPFSCQAVDILSELDVPAWKIGSGEVNNPFMLDVIIKTGKPILLSTGMSPMNEIEDTVEKIKNQKAPLALFQCTSSYPTPPEKVGLNILKVFKDKFKCPVGLSDHSGSIYPSLAAIAMGADIIEVHITFHKKMFGPDVSSSLTLEELRLVTEGAKVFHEMTVNPVSKDQVADELSHARSNFNKSLALVKELPTGTTLTKEMLTLKKPGTGIPVHDIQKVIGKNLRKKVEADVLLKWEDLG